MQEVTSIKPFAAGIPAQVDRPQPEDRPERGSNVSEQSTVDRVELSEAARDHDPEVEAARAMAARIRCIKAEIDEETYITPDKIDVVVERLHAELTRLEG